MNTVVVGRLTGVVGAGRRRGGVVVVGMGLFAGLVAGLVVDGRLVLPPIMPPPVIPPGSCCASATLLVVNNRTADRQSKRGDGKDIRFSPALKTRMTANAALGIIVKNARAWERLLYRVQSSALGCYFRGLLNVDWRPQHRIV